MKRNIILTSILLAFFLSSASPIVAAPFNAGGKNKQIVAIYLDPTSTHGVVSEPECNHVGIDVVKKNGNSGNFQQWSYGTQPCTGEPLHGDHDLWKLSKDGTCPDKATKIVQPNIGDPNYPGWGTYLEPGATYCVFNNKFHVTK